MYSSIMILHELVFLPRIVSFFLGTFERGKLRSACFNHSYDPDCCMIRFLLFVFFDFVFMA